MTGVINLRIGSEWMVVEDTPENRHLIDQVRHSTQGIAESAVDMLRTRQVGITDMFAPAPRTTQLIRTEWGRQITEWTCSADVVHPRRTE